MTPLDQRHAATLVNMLLALGPVPTDAPLDRRDPDEAEAWCALWRAAGCAEDPGQLADARRHHRAGDCQGIEHTELCPFCPGGIEEDTRGLG